MECKLMRCINLIILFVFLAAVKVAPQQITDSDFKPSITNPAFQKSSGHVVLIDEAHSNFHTAAGRYLPFAEFLRRDGYVVKSSAQKFSRDSFADAKVLVISNALNERNRGNWSLPTPSAFTEEEIAAVRIWVHNGGSLLLIADHMPFAGSVEKLAEVFGIKYLNGFARKRKTNLSPDIFDFENKMLVDHPLLRGRNRSEAVNSVTTFTGSAFQIKKDAEPLLVFSEDYVDLSPQIAWQFDEKTVTTPLKGWLQGATLKFGLGRIAVFGEAAMFSAQLSGPQRIQMGMNSPLAAQNPQFLLNVMHWLSGLIEE